MKQIALTFFIVLALTACKKDKQENIKVKYSVTGDNVNQFKISYGLTDNLLVVPFSGTKDTVIYQPVGTVVKLDTKADNNNLVGTIHVNDIMVATQTDSDTDGDGKTQVKLQYNLSQ